MSDLCGCLPPAAELARLAEHASAARVQPFVGTGDPGTVLACVHGSWPLGGVLADYAASLVPRCQAVRADGEPCGGRPGSDGFCAAHKPGPAEPGP